MSENKIKKLLLVADYGKDDLAFSEVKQRLYELAAAKGEHIQIDTVSVEPFNTAQTASVVAQAAKDGKYDIIYHNTAPRKDASKARVDNDGEGLYYARYQSNNGGKQVDIVGVNSGDERTTNTFALLQKEKSFHLTANGMPAFIKRKARRMEASSVRVMYSRLSYWIRHSNW